MSNFSTVYGQDFVKYKEYERAKNSHPTGENLNTLKFLNENYLTIDKPSKPPYENIDDYLIRFQKKHTRLIKKPFDKPVSYSKIQEYLKMESQYKSDYCKGNNKPNSVKIAPRNYDYVAGQGTTYLMGYQNPDFYGTYNPVTIHSKNKDTIGELLQIGRLYQPNVKLSEYQSQFNKNSRIYFNEMDK